MSEEDYLGMSIDLACQEKWREGAKRRTGDAWWGPSPIVELHSEGLDALNYLTEIEHRGVAHPEVVRELQRHALELVNGARILAKQAGLTPRPPSQPLSTSQTTDNPNARRAG